MNRRKHLFLILLLSLLLPVPLFSQAPEKPDSIYYLTVDPETGNDFMIWFSSPSPGVDYYQVGEAHPSDLTSLLPVGMPVLVPDTFFININTESGNRSAYYSVWAVNDDGLGSGTPSLYDALHNTIFLTAQYDSCIGKIDLEWNNYIRWNGKIREYNIKRRISPGNYITLNPAPIPEGTNTYTLDHLAVDEQYDIFIEAVHIDGRRTSNSNMTNTFNDVTPGPAWINADYATVTPENRVNLSFTPEIPAPYEYSLQRSSDSRGPFITITNFTNGDATITYEDDVNASTGIYYYSLMIEDVCGNKGAVSNIASNILLSGDIQNYTINLIWSDYMEWSGGVQSYELRRYTAGSVSDAVYNTGNLTEYTDDVTSLVNYLTPLENEICYEVFATETPNIHGITGTSLSNRLCFRVDVNVRFPNAIIPNDIEPQNRLFEPVFNFAPESYEVIIYNRLGLKVWEGQGPWDGTSSGNPVKEGVYLYYVKVNTGTGQSEEYSGKLTVLYR